MTFYEKLVKLCEEKGFAVSNIGQFIMVNGTPISRSATGTWRDGVKPRPVTLAAIANYFKVPVSYLQDDDETQPNRHGDCANCPCADDCQCRLSAQEHQLIRMFREASELGKMQMVSKVLAVWEQNQRG